MTTDPCSTARRTSQALELALERLHMAPARRQQLEQAHASSVSLADWLDWFEHEYFPLSVDDGASATLAGVREQWLATEPGLLRSGSELERLVTMSPTLGRLHRAGMLVRSLKQFSAGELAFATELGDHFGLLAEPWARLKVQLDRKRCWVWLARAQLDGFLALVERLAALDVFTWDRVEARTFQGPEKGWEEVAVDRLRQAGGRYRSKHPFRVHLVRGGCRSANPLVTGEWLNAYAAAVIESHLVANDVPFELYTNVQYKAPADVIDGCGDFDVLVEAEGRVAVVECKTGKLDGPALSKVVDHDLALRRVLEVTGSEVSPSSFLLYNPAATSPDLVGSGLDGSAVVPITPSEVRRTVHELFVRGR